jgi:opacity protein-like surface antigen
MKRLLPSLALLLALSPIAAAHAQDASGYRSGIASNYRFELTPTLSYRFGGTIYRGDSSLFSNDVTIDDSVAYGATFDIPLSSNMQLELLANRQSSQLRFDQGLFGTNIDVADIDVSYYHVGLLWQWGRGQVIPFFTASLGDTNLDPKVPGASSDDRFSMSLGGGVKVLFTDSIGLRFEGRGFFTDIGGGNSRNHRYNSCDYYGDCYNDTLSQGQASIGLIFAW